MTNRKKLLLTLSMLLGLNTSVLMAEITQTQLNATLGIVTNFILDDGITHNGTTYKTVTSPYTGRVWLDRNLGASQVCTSFDDALCYGDYYQWGRGYDGHQESSSSDTPTLANDVTNVGHGDFITNNFGTYDWASVDGSGNQRADNWLKADGSSVCPVGFRVPTLNELQVETVDNGVTDNDTAFTNFLKLPSAGYHSSFNGLMKNVGSHGTVWSSSASGTFASNLLFNSSSANLYSTGLRATGRSVRCIKGETIHQHNGKVYGEVTSPYTGKVWLDRNLGASQVCTSLDDALCYGDYYQWGRGYDGHQESNSSTTTTLATDVTSVSHGDFITGGKFGPHDWASVDTNGSQRYVNWSKTDGSTICPIGFRVPNATELQAETVDNGVIDNTTAFDNFLKLSSSSYRSGLVGLIGSVGTHGSLWTSSPATILFFDSGTAGVAPDRPHNGCSVRCIKD